MTGLFDLKRGESGNKEFQRGMDEYFQRFQRVIDCGEWHRLVWRYLRSYSIQTYKLTNLVALTHL